uniref:Uncharacterized protein n=1 Tax=Odontella aurita TaxID=265563 RepID=A0A7S4K901_9STRA|mmetsp:Transcript_7065/g.21108  ORF Transcript_7065/g.21108 Transcript_7065/m.21108 type:complete len:370 (+) Transcript_7065:82-1191(+)
MHQRKHRNQYDHDDGNDRKEPPHRMEGDLVDGLVREDPPYCAPDKALEHTVGADWEESSSSSSSLSSSSSFSSESVAWSTLRRKPLRQETKWSLASNTAFLLGSMLQTLPATWDLLELCAEGGDDDAENVDSDRDSAREHLYFFLTASGAFLYLVNALIDLAWATSGQERRAGRSWCQFDHDVRWEVWSAVAFGVGAAREFVGAVVFSRSGDDDDDDDLAPEESRAAARNNVLSMSTYLISGVLSLKGRGALTCTACWSCRRSLKRNIVAILVEVGEILFIFGSVADLALAFLDNRTVVDVPELTLAWGNFVSSLMWLVDAVLLLLSECIRHSLCIFRRRVGTNMLPVAMHVPLLPAGNNHNHHAKPHF